MANTHVGALIWPLEEPLYRVHYIEPNLTTEYQMHELGIVQSILEIIEEQLKIHEGERVVKIQLEFGAMTAVMPEAIEFAFQALTREGPVAGATLDITIIPIKGVCLDCGKQVELDSYAPFCPVCSNGILNIFQGKDEMRIVSIEIE